MKGNAFDKEFFLSSTPFFCERNVGNNLDFLSLLEILVGSYKLKLRLFGSFQWKISVTNGILDLGLPMLQQQQQQHLLLKHGGF